MIEGAVGLAGGAFCYDWLDEKDIDVRRVPRTPESAKPGDCYELYLQHSPRKCRSREKM